MPFSDQLAFANCRVEIDGDTITLRCTRCPFTAIYTWAAPEVELVDEARHHARKHVVAERR